MADESVKVRRTLLLRLKAPTPDAAKVLGAMMQNTAAMYQAFGDAKVQLLRNADDPSQFLQIIEFQSDQAVERSRQKIASDPTMQNFLQAWRAMFPGAADAEVYEDVGE
jgi:quinol monooxygenase YgiN